MVYERYDTTHIHSYQQEGMRVAGGGVDAVYILERWRLPVITTVITGGPMMFSQNGEHVENIKKTDDIDDDDDDDSL